MKKLLLPVIFALVPLIGGVLLIAFPAKAVMLAFILLSIFLISSGARNLFLSIRFRDLPTGVRTVGMIKNTVSLLLGMLILWKSIASPESLLSFVVYVVAGYLLLNAVMDAVDTSFMRRLGLGNGAGMDVIINLIFAIIMFLFPRFIGSTFLTVIGIILIMLGAVMLTGAIRGWRMHRDIRPPKDEAIDVEWEERK